MKMDKNDEFNLNKFSKNEIDVIRKIWDDLVEKSNIDNNKGISKDVFISFTNIDGLIGIRLFEIFDKKSNHYIDFDDFIEGLEIICFGTHENQVKFLFKLFDVKNNLKIEKDFMNVIINSIPHDFICKCSHNHNTFKNENNLNENLNQCANYEIWTNNCICRDAFNQFDKNNHKYLEFEEFNEWFKSNKIIMSYIKSKMNFSPQSESKRKKSISKTDILPITTLEFSVEKYENTMWKKCKRTGLKIKRHFLLYGSCLYYYKSKNDFKPRGVIFLSGSNIIPIKNHFLEISELNMIHNETNFHQDEFHQYRKKIFECDTKELRDEWVNKLQKASHIIPFETVYKLEEQIGFGAFSSVYKCKRIADNKIFAVKIISKENMLNSNKINLKNEISILKLVSHPNIIHMDSFFETKTNIFIVIELIENGDLFKNIMNRKTFSELELKKLAKTLAECMAYLHELGIVHRDIKPENILLDKKSDKLILTDFGLAQIILPNSKLLDTCGTLDYVAPEIINSQGYGMESDIWSFGVILYLVYYGQLPFSSDSDEHTMQNIIHNDVVLHSNKNIHANDLISKCLNKNPQQRITAIEILSHPFILLNEEN